MTASPVVVEVAEIVDGGSSAHLGKWAEFGTFNEGAPHLAATVRGQIQDVDPTGITLGNAQIKRDHSNSRGFEDLYLQPSKILISTICTPLRITEERLGAD